MNLLNVDSFFQPMVIGVVIVLAVEADVIRNAVREAGSGVHAGGAGMTARRPGDGPDPRRRRRPMTTPPAIAVRQRRRSGSAASSRWTTSPLEVRARRGRRAPRRQRRRQVDADQVPHRRPPPGRGHDRDGRTPRPDRLPGRRPGAGHRDRLPGPRAVRQPRSRRRTSTPAASSRRRPGCRAGCASCGRGRCRRRPTSSSTDCR